MSPAPIVLNGAGIDLSPRCFHSATVVASPTTSAETIIASVTLSRDLAAGLGVLVIGFAAYTVGTDGTGVNLKIHRTDASGTTVKASGITTAVAANLGALSIAGLDVVQPAPGAVYVLTLTVAAASAGSTVSAVELTAIVI
jgi:hypothetical protein